MRILRKIFSREILLYLLFGVLTTVVNFGVFQGALGLLGKGSHHLANLLAFLCAATFAYGTNKLFVFESRSFARKVLRKELPTFFGARVLSFLLEEAGIFLLIDTLGWHRLPVLGEYGELAVKALLAVVVVALNYVFSKLFIFKKTEEPPCTPNRKS